MVKPGPSHKTELNALKNKPPWKWPKGAEKLFLKILRDQEGDLSDRLTAAELAGDLSVINDKLVEALLVILQNSAEPENLRIRAAISIGPVLEYSCTFGLEANDNTISHEMVEHIEESFHGLYEATDVPKKVRRRILEVSVRAPQGWHKKAIHEAYAGNDLDLKITAVFCMGFISGFENEIIEAMECDNPIIRNEAVRAAGNWQVDTDWLDIDSPLISGEDDNPLFKSTLKFVAGDHFSETSELYNLPQHPNDEEILDTLNDFLTGEDLPWDDELVDIDDDDDF